MRPNTRTFDQCKPRFRHANRGEQRLTTPEPVTVGDPRDTWPYHQRSGDQGRVKVSSGFHFEATELERERKNCGKTGRNFSQVGGGGFHYYEHFLFFFSRFKKSSGNATPFPPNVTLGALQKGARGGPPPRILFFGYFDIRILRGEFPPRPLLPFLILPFFLSLFSFSFCPVN